MKKHLVIVGVVGLTALAGCASSGNLTGQAGKVDTGSSSPGTSTAAPKRATVGHAILVSGNDGLKASVTLATVRRTRKPANQYAGAPKNGTYVVCKVLIAVTAGDYDFNPLYFKYQNADGTTYDGTAGIEAGFSPQLDAGRLHAGQRTGGLIAFDAPVGVGVVQLTDPLGGVVGEWTV